MALLTLKRSGRDSELGTDRAMKREFKNAWSIVAGLAMLIAAGCLDGPNAAPPAKTKTIERRTYPAVDRKTYPPRRRMKARYA